jgi:phosphate transport system protein
MEREHIIRQYDLELNEIRQKLLEMGGKVEVMIANAMRSLVERDSALADETIRFDHQINHLEVEIDEKCLHVLATRQPAARDLRFITLALKIVTDLERIGDQCAAIAKRATELNREPPLKPYIDLPRMAQAASIMVREALDAFVRGDDAMAIKVCQDDQFVDDLSTVTCEPASKLFLTFRALNPVISDNAANVERSVASLSTETATKAKPDGHTLLVAASTTFVLEMLLKRRQVYTPVKELVPVCNLAISAFVMAVNPAVPVNSLRELADYAAANSQKVTFGSGGRSSHTPR